MTDWRITNKKFCFNVEQLDFNSDDDKAYKEILETLLINGLAEYEDFCYWVEPMDIYSLDFFDKKTLKIPTEYPYTIFIESEGVINREGFNFKVGFYNYVPYGEKYKVTIEENIITLEKTGAVYLFSKEQFQLLRKLDSANQVSAHNFDAYSMFKATAEIKTLTKNTLNVYLDEYLYNENIVVPNKISIDVDYSDGVLRVNPVLEEIKASNYSDEFKKRITPKTNTKITNANNERVRVIFSDDQIEQLKVIKKECAYVTDPERINEIINNPEQLFDTDIIDLSLFYSDRVIAYGLYKPRCYPFISPYKSEWIPGVEVQSKTQGTTRISFKNIEDLNLFEKEIERSEAKNSNTIQYNDTTISIEDAKQVVEFSKKQFAHKLIPKDYESNNEKKVLIIQENADELEYLNAIKEKNIKNKMSLLPVPNLNSFITLKDHQVEGIAWLQYLYTNNYKGCLLADDMGLGKTLQILYFIDWYLTNQSYEKNKPCLIVAPISLLENWEAEFGKFFDLETYDINISTFLSKDISKQYKKEDINRLSACNIVLTNYETIRSCQLNFCAVDFAIIATDEAQKIKTPGTMVTNALKALKGDFKVALTGTPVENSFLDLWCIIDFAVPGLLGNAKQFGIKFQNRLKDKNTNIIELGNSIRAELGDYIKRRLKKDVNLNLPRKYINKIQVAMPDEQQDKYAQEINHVIALKENREMNKGDILTYILRLKRISDHPYILDYNINELDCETLVNTSAKLIKTIDILKNVQRKEEKVIIYTESKIVQKMLRRIIKSYFGITPSIINGDTPATPKNTTKSLMTRQSSVNYFESIKGFNVIIMSPIAAGMGLNVVGANHVIHYSRHWNPAKEEQATDRVYRIGQNKEVHIYYPIGVSKDFETFDVLIDRLLSNKREIADATLFPSEKTEVSTDELFTNLYTHPIENITKLITTDQVLKFDNDTIISLLALLYSKDGYLIDFKTAKNIKGIDFIISNNGNSFLVKCTDKIVEERYLRDLLDVKTFAKNIVGKELGLLYYTPIINNPLREVSNILNINLVDTLYIKKKMEIKSTSWNELLEFKSQHNLN